MCKYSERSNTKDLLSLRAWETNYIQSKVSNISLQNKICNIYKNSKLPLAKIFGEKYFWKYKFKTNKHTLDPRSDTEIILECLHKYYDVNSKCKVLELGVGTGAVIISSLLDFRNWTGYAIDISYKALRVARYNNRQHCTTKRLVIYHNNWLDNIYDNYDILIANPPYLQPHEYSTSIPDPYISLVEPLDLYFYKQIAQRMHQFKHVFLEISTTRPVNDYINLFLQYKYMLHYNFNNLPIILEVYNNKL